jgi:hypothetical protein
MCAIVGGEHVLRVFCDTERDEEIVAPVTEAERELILVAIQFLEVGRTIRIGALADVSLKIDVGSPSPPILVTDD